MKRIVAGFVLVLSVGCLPSFAKEGPCGAGIILGDPSGISLGYKLDADSSLQAALAWDLISPGGFTLTGDYIFHFDRIFKVKSTFIPLYTGIGAKLTILAGTGRFDSSASTIGLAARIPLGIRWEFPDLPLEAFLELVPGLRLFPDTTFDAGMGLGIRWYF